MVIFFFFFFKQKTAYEIYQCDWSSDVCSSDLSYGTWAFILSVLPDCFYSAVQKVRASGCI